MAVEPRIQLFFIPADVRNGNVLEIPARNGVEDTDLVRHFNRFVAALLEDFNDALTLIQTLTRIAVKVGAELREALQLAVLRIQQLQTACDLFHRLDLRVAADTRHRDTGVHGRHDACVE